MSFTTNPKHHTQLRLSSAFPLEIPTSASVPSSHPIPTEPRMSLIDLRAPGVRRTTRGSGLISSLYLTACPPKLWLAFHPSTANPPPQTRHQPPHLPSLYHELHTPAHTRTRFDEARRCRDYPCHLFTNLTDLTHRMDPT
ncbi:hypothetical protein B0H14DRAFT_3531915 [Mycena olivaceomarginata]|nr:hypothetical protein B0H14DRAFT_3531915 [Mycena olivaceomarginata]